MPSPTGELRYQQFYTWEVYSLLVLGIALTGIVPLTVGTGIAVGLFVSQLSDWWIALPAGVGAAAAMFVLDMGLLWAFTRDPVRQRFIPWSRRWFPTSDEVRDRGPRHSSPQTFTPGVTRSEDDREEDSDD